MTQRQRRNWPGALREGRKYLRVGNAERLGEVVAELAAAVLPAGSW